MLCHGLGGAIRRDLVAAGRTFAERYYVITGIRRGFGNSTAHSGRSGIDEAAGDLIAVLDALDSTLGHLVGQFMGAFRRVASPALNHSDRPSLSCCRRPWPAPIRATPRIAGRVPDVHAATATRSCRPLPARRPDLVVCTTSSPASHQTAGGRHARGHGDVTGLGDEELGRTGATDAVSRCGETTKLCPPLVMKTAAARIPGSVSTCSRTRGHSA